MNEFKLNCRMLRQYGTNEMCCECDRRPDHRVGETKRIQHTASELKLWQETSIPRAVCSH